MSFRELDKHQSCGWDFDGTIYDHPKSELMHAYIKAHPEKRHVIVTFRSHGWQNDVWENLYSTYPDAPEKGCFEGIVNIDDEIYAKFHDASRGPVLLMGDDIRAYTEWKGQKCAELGLTVLIDDMTMMVVDGCKKHNIVHIHPDDL